MNTTTRLPLPLHAAAAGTSAPAVEPTPTAVRDALVRKHLPLVRHVAGKLAHLAAASTLLEFDDLVAFGVEGLIAAVDSFNPARGTQFSTWAGLHIRTTILDRIRELDHLPRSLRRQAKQIEEARAAMAQQRQAWPTQAEVATALELPVRSVRETMRLVSRTVVSLDSAAPWSGGEDGGTLTVVLPMDEDPETQPGALLERQATLGLLRDAVDALPEREAAVVLMYYLEGRSMKVIGARLGVSESRVSQIHARALRLLRTALTAADADTVTSRHMAA